MPAIHDEKIFIYRDNSFKGDFEIIDGVPSGKGKITYNYGLLEEFKKNNIKKL